MMIEPLTQQHALEIANDWHYEVPYDFYDMKNDLEDYEEMVSPEMRGDRYFQVLREGELYGFFCLEQKGERILELGLGTKPEHCGKGQGATFLQEILDFIIENFAPQVIRLYVADFNHRAQQLYLNMGFEVVRRIPQESNGGIHLFVDMVKKV
ncbi:GNAT family N-acetyltransferase [Streptococcus sanguinis]|uniref:GNAT family N-acetyltransferase n=1 Tax=Streptococcus sanguinis TaxID=1305 RepID=UPI001CBF0FC9|nr:GNAT family N-acetyltransferase [Streptococcus sanguinis]MBZ2020048.1 GNAT family N-acetyltransferase [Streptococcus sanguinis]